MGYSDCVVAISITIIMMYIAGSSFFTILNYKNLTDKLEDLHKSYKKDEHMGKHEEAYSNPSKKILFDEENSIVHQLFRKIVGEIKNQLLPEDIINTGIAGFVMLILVFINFWKQSVLWWVFIVGNILILLLPDIILIPFCVSIRQFLYR